MGLWKIIKGSWDPAASIESTIEVQVNCYESNKRHYPGRDPNAWLALTLQSRPRWRSNPELWYYTFTAQFSLLPGFDGPATLALFILQKERPDLPSDLARGMELKFIEMMTPVRELVREGLFYIRWREVNPWTATHFPIAAEAISRSQKEGFGMLDLPTPDELGEGEEDWEDWDGKDEDRGHVPCPFCQRNNPADAKFCNRCGKRIPDTIKCSHCGAGIPGGSRFCSSCGEAITSVEGE